MPHFVMHIQVDSEVDFEVYFEIPFQVHFGEHFRQERYHNTIKAVSELYQRTTGALLKNYWSTLRG